MSAAIQSASLTLLPSLDDGDLLVSRDDKAEDPQFVISYTSKRPPFWAGNRHYKMTNQVALADDLERAISTADAWAIKKCGRDLSLQ